MESLESANRTLFFLFSKSASGGTSLSHVHLVSYIRRPAHMRFRFRFVSDSFPERVPRGPWTKRSFALSPFLLYQKEGYTTPSTLGCRRSFLLMPINTIPPHRSERWRCVPRGVTQTRGGSGEGPRCGQLSVSLSLSWTCTSSVLR